MSTLHKWLFYSVGVAILQAASGTVVINEIHYNPDVKTEPVEFIELYNSGPGTVDLSGWQFDDGVAYTFPGGTTLAANDYLVIAKNPSALLTKFGTTALGPWDGKLSNDGETIVLRNAVGDLMDEVDYQLGFPWPTVGDSPDYSIELINPDLDNDLGGNWRRSYDESSGIIPYQEAISAESTWRYRKAVSEASTPTTLWRDVNFDDSGWATGQAPIGYQILGGVFIPGFVKTTLSDMQYSYMGVFLRKTFIVDDPTEVGLLILDAAYDDGFKAWINGVNVTNVNIAAGEVPYNGTANSSLIDNITYYQFLLSNPESYLLPGTNVIAIQAHNNGTYAGQQDFWFDAKLTVDVGTSNGPTPGQQNWVYTNNAPPAIRQVDHEPREPASGQNVTVTAKVTDPEGVSAVWLGYQIVTPGNYIELTDLAYATNWTALPMHDDGSNGDALAGDSIYTAVIPASAQQHRNLIRYKLAATDGTGTSIIAPYADDPQPNFAYFCSDGVPEWQGAVQPGTTPVLNFSTNTMRRFPSVHLISKKDSVETATWFERYSGNLYKWTGTLVYDGNVYDHIRYRARGGAWRYAMCKNMWKFDFNRGHDFQMRDDYGRKYGTKWTKLNLGACIMQGNNGYRGEQGMFESVGSRLFNLAGVPSFNTSFLQFRIIDEEAEQTADQYEGDFWGLYLATEQPDGRFLDEHGLPDGNLYKMLKTGTTGPANTGELNNIGPLGPTDQSDLSYIINNYTDASDAWWRQNWKLEDFYSYQTILLGIHHYDINFGKNYFYFNNPETGRWEVFPWDLDLTWADNMWKPSWGGLNKLASRILDATAGNEFLQLPGDTRPTFRMEFRNRVREIRDLLFNADQAGQVIDEYANLLRDPETTLSFLDADRCMWDYNPKMIDPAYTAYLDKDKAGHGKFYQWPLPAANNFNGGVQLMKNYVTNRSALLDNLATDAAIPNTPGIQYTGTIGYPTNGLSFQCSGFSDPDGNETFSAIQWRAGEILNTNAPAYDPTRPPPYEITAIWESGEITEQIGGIIIPSDALKVGHAYRVRARMKDNTGRWSHWSDPEEFMVNVDSDGDGMPDNWETSYGLNPNSDADAELDSDDDGLTNLDEYMSGTNPIDPSSAFKIEWIGLSNTVMTLQFSAMAGRSYAVLYRPELSKGNWNALTNITAEESSLEMFVTDPSWTLDDTRYYRLVTPANAIVDSDGDGLINIDEYIAGTDPHDPNSVFEIEQLSLSNSVVSLKFMPIAGKSYSVLYRCELDTGTWNALTNISAGAGTNSIWVSYPIPTNNTGFYRLATPAVP